MKPFWRLLFVVSLGIASSAPGRHAMAQDPPPQQGQGPGQDQGPARGGERRPGLFGKLTAIHDQSIEISTPRGDTVTVKIGSDTQFRKEREAAKLSDFKVGDMIFVRGQENADHTWTAQMIGSRPAGFGGGFGGGQGSGEGRAGPGGGAGYPGMRQMGVLGQDYVVGEIKSLDAPKLTILRPDNVTQTIELSEETSLRKGRDSITMADIQSGDRVFVRGATANGVFQPKNLIVISPEQWQRMQQMNANGQGGQPPKLPEDNKPQTDEKPRNPPEPRR